MALRTLLAAAMALALLACSAPGQRPADIVVGEGWTREVAPGQSVAAAYLTITNNGEGSDRLVDIDSAYGDAALHTTSSADGIARMRPLEGGLEIAPRSTVELKPGGTHIMFAGIKQRPAVGQMIDLTLNFEKSGEEQVKIRVVPAAGDVAHSGHSK